MPKSTTITQIFLKRDLKKLDYSSNCPWQSSLKIHDGPRQKIFCKIEVYSSDDPWKKIGTNSWKGPFTFVLIIQDYCSDGPSKIFLKNHVYS